MKADMPPTARGCSRLRASAGLLVALIAGIHCGGESPTAPAIATALSFSVPPAAGATAGIALAPVRVAIVDADGGTVGSADADVTIAIASGTGPPGATLTGTLTRAAVDGVATFDDLVITTAGAGYAFSASASGLTGASSPPFAVDHAAAHGLAFVTQPVSSAAGASVPPVRVAVRDAFGNSVITPVTVTLAITAGSGTPEAVLNGTVTQASVEGIATFENLAITRAGTDYTLTASAPDLDGATSAVFSISSGAASAIAFLTEPVSTVAGAVLAPAVRVAVLDAHGNTVAAPAEITLAITGGTGAAGAVLGGTATREAVAGIATFDDLVITAAGAGYTLTATASGISQRASSAFGVAAAAPTVVAFLTEPGSTTAGTVLAPVITVAVRDQFGNAATSSPAVSLAITSGTGSSGAVLGGTVTRQPIEGIATFDDLVITKAGSGYRLRASVTADAADTSIAFAINAGAPANVTIGPVPATARESRTLPGVVDVIVRDAHGNGVSGAGVTLALTPGPGTVGSTLGGTLTRASVNGTASFDGLSIASPATRTYSLTATTGAISSAPSPGIRVVRVDVLGGSIAQITYDSLWQHFDRHDPVRFPNIRTQPNVGWDESSVRADLNAAIDLAQYDFILTYTSREVPGWINCCRINRYPDVRNTGVLVPGLTLDPAYPKLRGVVHMNAAEYTTLLGVDEATLVAFHEMGHVWTVKMLGFLDIASHNWVEGVHPVALLAGGSAHWGFSWFKGGLPSATVGIMYSAPLSPTFNSFDLYQMGLMGYEEAKTHSHQVALCSPWDSDNNCKIYPFTIDSLIAGYKYVYPDSVIGNGRRIPDLDPEVSSLRTLVLLVRGKDDVIDPVHFADLQAVAARISSGWSTATWGRSQMSIGVIER